MVRGTTPTHTFIFPFSSSLIETLFITYKQVIGNGKSIIIEKGLNDCETIDNKLIVKLTQEETLTLVHGVQTEIQVRVKTHDGEALASQIIRVSTEEILKDGVI